MLTVVHREEYFCMWMADALSAISQHGPRSKLNTTRSCNGRLYIRLWEGQGNKTSLSMHNSRCFGSAEIQMILGCVYCTYKHLFMGNQVLTKQMFLFLWCISPLICILKVNLLPLQSTRIALRKAACEPENLAFISGKDLNTCFS